MLSINGLPLRMVETYVKESNLHLPAERLLHISLVNGPRAVVVTGHPLSLYGLQVRLRKIRAPSSGSDQQNKVPFSKRLLKFSTRYLNVSSAFHNPLYLSQVPLAVAKDMQGVYFPLRSDQQVPVYSTYDGTDLRNDDGEPSLVLQLTQLICTREVHWEKATAGTFVGLLNQKALTNRDQCCTLIRLRVTSLNLDQVVRVVFAS